MQKIYIIKKAVTCNEQYSLSLLLSHTLPQTTATTVTQETQRTAAPQY